MSDIYKDKINDKTIYLLKPTKWNFHNVKNMGDKTKLNSSNFIKYVLFYAQKYFEDEENIISLKELDKYKKETINDLFIQYVNSDNTLLSKYNDKIKAENIYQACNFIKNYINKILPTSGFGFIELFGLVWITGFWFEVLKGNFTSNKFESYYRTIEVILYIYRENPDYDNNFSKDTLEDYLDNKDYYYEFCKNISKIINMTKQKNLWIPSICSEDIFNELLEYNLFELDKLDIKNKIIQLSKDKINDKMLKDLINKEYFEGHEKILSESFEAHKSELYSPAITCLLTQIDYLIYKIAEYLDLVDSARNANTTLITKISHYLYDNIILEKPLSEFFSGKNIGEASYYFQLMSLINFLNNIGFVDTNKIENGNQLNRHGILHGKFLKYSNEDNSKLAVLLIYEMSVLFDEIIKNKING